MTESESSELEKFQKTARSIRSSSDYSVPLGIIGKYLGLPASVTDYEIEALLIAATREKFKESLDADMALMALGLLKEFPSPRDSSENRSGIDLITVRRKKFIWTSSYIADRHSSSNKRRKVFYESCEDLEAAGEDAIKAVVKALNTEDGDAINAVAQKLYSKKIKINKYLDEAKEYLIYNKKGNIVNVKLQELKNIRQLSKNTASSKQLMLEDGVIHSVTKEIPQDNYEKSLNSVKHFSNKNDSAEKFAKHDNQLNGEAIEPPIIESTDSDAPDVSGDVASSNESNIELLPITADGNSASTDNEISNSVSAFYSPIEDELNDKTEKKAEENIEQANGDNETKPTERKLNAFLSILLASGLILALAIALIIVGYCVVSQNKIISEKEAAKKIAPTKIEIMEKNIMLPLGGGGYLKVKTEPSELNLNDLLYTSSNRDVVHMEDIHSNYMIATDDLADTVKNYSEIIVQGMDGVAQDTEIFIFRLNNKN